MELSKDTYSVHLQNPNTKYVSVLMKGTRALQQQTATINDTVFNFHILANSFHDYIIIITGYMTRQYSSLADVYFTDNILNIGSIKGVLWCTSYLM